MSDASIKKRLRLLTAKIVHHPVVAFIAKQPVGWLFVVGSIIALTAFAFSLAIQTITSTLIFDGSAANGAFQSLNPLRRLAIGQAIGNDFNFFHGIGVPLIHAPFYYLFGQGMVGSELARWLVSPMLFVGSTFLFFYVFRRRFVFALSMTAVMTAIGMVVMPFLIFPITSLLGVRSVMAVLLMALMLQQQRLKKPIPKAPSWLRNLTIYEALVGLLLAIALLCGTEFGIAAILAFFIANTLYKTEAPQRFVVRVLSSARVFGVFVVSLLGLLTIVTRGKPLKPLKFALGEVPSDQFWYFGVPPNNFLHFDNIIPTFRVDTKLHELLLIALVGIALVFVVHLLRAHRVQCQAFIFGLLAGMFAMVSMLGYYHHSEASAFARMSLLVSAACLAILLSYWKKPLGLSFEVGKLKRGIFIPPKFALFVLGVVFIAFSIGNFRDVMHHLKQNYDIVGAGRKVKAYIAGTDSNLLGGKWHAVDQAIIPVIQADNNVGIADVNEGEYTHGISTVLRQVIVEPGEHSSFIHPGQIVYFVKAGRQIIDHVEQQGEDRFLVTLEKNNINLDPKHDGAPSRLIITEDFNHDNSKVWSMYTGLIEEEIGLFNPTGQGYDYVIHALGEERRKEYTEDFRRVKPQFVLTLSRPYFGYEEWLQNAHWDFYSLLDQNYEVVKESSIYVVWKKRATAWTDTHKQSQPWQPLTINDQDSRIDLPALPFDGVADVNAYNIEKQRLDRERRLALGQEIKEIEYSGADEYDAFRTREERAKRAYELFRRENSGPETDTLEHQKWLEAAAGGKSEIDVGPTPRLFVERPKRQVMLVKLQYEVSHPLQKLPLLGKTTRYLVEPNNVYSRTPISLRPYDNEVTFPLVISELNQGSYLRFNAYSLLPGDGNFKITSAEWTLLDTSVPNLKALTD